MYRIRQLLQPSSASRLELAMDEEECCRITAVQWSCGRQKKDRWEREQLWVDGGAVLGLVRVLCVSVIADCPETL